MSSSNSPCAACKFLRRKCTQECVFAPYFPADQPTRFANVHKVFGASNVAKILNELDKSNREDAVNSLAYEAECRLRDPVYGCVGSISHLQHHLKQLQVNLELAKKELASMVGPQQMIQMLQNPYLQAQLHPTMAAAAAASPYNMAQMMGMVPTGPGPGHAPLVIAEPHHHQMPPQQQPHHVGQLMMRDAHLQVVQEQQHAMEAQQLAAMMQVREEQEIMRSFDHHQLQQHQQHQQHQQQHSGNLYQHQQLQQQQQQQQHQLLRFDDNEEFCQMGNQGTSASPLLALGGSGFDASSYQMQQQHLQQDQQPLLLLQQPQQSDSEAVQTIEHQQQQQVEQRMFPEQPISGSGHDEGRTGGHSC